MTRGRYFATIWVRPCLIGAALVAVASGVSIYILDGLVNAVSGTFISFAIVLLILLIITAIPAALFALFSYSGPAYAQQAGLCRWCGYTLDGLNGDVCPECGELIEDEDRAPPPAPAEREIGLLSGWVVDRLGPGKHREFVMYWFGLSASVSGSLVLVGMALGTDAALARLLIAATIAPIPLGLIAYVVTPRTADEPTRAPLTQPPHQDVD